MGLLDAIYVGEDCKVVNDDCEVAETVGFVEGMTCSGRAVDDTVFCHVGIGVSTRCVGFEVGDIDGEMVG